MYVLVSLESELSSLACSQTPRRSMSIRQGYAQGPGFRPQGLGDTWTRGRLGWFRPSRR